MASVNIEQIIDHLDSDIRHALEDTVRSVIPDAQFDQYELFREFRRAVGRRCMTWENVPDGYVRR
ncbi:MAG: hypothetical protein V3R17_06700 [Hyphomicrobium sp.]